MNFATDQQRHVVVGATGSGKTHGALWFLSKRNYDRMPWIVYDFKRDEMIGEIPGANYISVDSEIPEAPGIYVVNPLPDDSERVESQMWKIWEKENTGVFIDEGYMIGNHNKGFRALLTQGRSKWIPMITLSQRPVYMDRFVFTEAEYFSVFRLQHRGDMKNVNQFIPYDLSERLPERHSYYYEVPTNQIAVLAPVTDRAAILSTFDTKLRKLRKVI